MLATTGQNCNKPKTIRLHVSSLAVGMFICELDRPWLETPFLLQGFEVQSSADVAEVQKDRKSTRLNSSHITISYAVFCLKKKKKNTKKKNKQMKLYTISKT